MSIELPRLYGRTKWQIRRKGTKYMGNKDGENKTKVDNIRFDCTKSEYAVQTLMAAVQNFHSFKFLYILLKGVGMANSQTNKIHILKTTKYIRTSLRYDRIQEANRTQ
jgi:hypothetical protein